jgi:hypothetical protein
MTKTADGSIYRRELLKLLGVGGIVHSAALSGCGPRGTIGIAPPPSPGSLAAEQRATEVPLAAPEPFTFLQLSDTHWGYSGAANPEASSTLRRAVATINASALPLDFVVFTGDLTHTTPDGAERRRRMKEFQSIVSELKVPVRRFLPGEHDADQDEGAAFHELFGESHYTFDHKGVHFVALDNVSDPGKVIGHEQLDWLANDLKNVRPEAPIVVFAHRPLFELMPAWDWTTADGSDALRTLATHQNVTVFYGHIHQEHHFKTGAIAHHAARSLIFPLPAPGSVPKKAPLPWDDTVSDHGIGYRTIQEAAGSASPEDHPLPLSRAVAP